jgi:hypothetical protein
MIQNDVNNAVPLEHIQVSAACSLQESINGAGASFSVPPNKTVKPIVAAELPYLWIQSIITWLVAVFHSLTTSNLMLVLCLVIITA